MTAASLTLSGGKDWPTPLPHVYALTVMAVSLAALVRWLLDPYLREHHPFVLFLVPVLVAAWVAGWKPATLAAALGYLAADYLFVHPRGAVGFHDAEHVVGAAFFVAVSGIGIGLVEQTRAARRQAEGQAASLRGEVADHEQTQARLREAQAQLERRVETRTAELSHATHQLSEEEAARRAAEGRVRRLAAIVASSEDAIIGQDLAGTITDWNAGAEHLLAYPAAEVVGRPAAVIVPADRRDEAERVTGRLARGEDVRPYETVRLRRGGVEVPVSIRVSPIRDDGQLVGRAEICRDLTYAKRLEERLRQSQKMESIGQLAGGVAHDFNNILTVINGYTDLILQDLGPDDPRRGLLKQVHDAGTRAAALTQQLLAFSRKQVLQPRVLDLGVVVRDSERMLRRLIGEDVHLATVIRPDLGRVKVDPTQMEQVLLNLAVNARDAMPRGGRLTVEAANVNLDEGYADAHPEVWPGRYVMLAVADTGTGMDEGTKARMFDPFYTTKGVGKGTGLGLAVVHGIVKQSGGHVVAYSEVGLGTTVKMCLPAVEGLGTAGKSHPRITTGPRGSETVLLVEDEAAVRQFSRAALQLSGYTVLEAGHGGEAVRLAERYEGPIHLLVSDVVMPEMGGRLLAERLSASRPGIKVVFVSGYTDDAIVRHGVLEAGVAFLQKPFSPADLARKVREVLDSKE
ncbi:PAS domain S-box protein [Limnoglobus roseus]|uniref:histidine kinase n=1 Tax=Limnoglobus roseus TaxID=2598579 RepID=A0A5C1ABK5_9BACT|nr:PAS domain S-box protein [Limnoglobus roseus]QEL15587.1 PAS domain-containing sensor histidine kinase [Limnoglobus roseus]